MSYCPATARPVCVAVTGDAAGKWVGVRCWAADARLRAPLPVEGRLCRSCWRGEHVGEEWV